MVHKVANTVGRVMTTGISMANKTSSALQSHDQPELDARYVYVGVHADGPTRVLCFSETRDEYTRGTNEESVALLTEKLKSLEERNRVSSRLRLSALTIPLQSAMYIFGTIKGRNDVPKYRSMLNLFRTICSPFDLTSNVQEVDAELRSIDDKQNIDMALAMGESTDRSSQHVKDQMKIPNRPSMRLGRERTLSRDLAAVGSLVSISRAPSLARTVSII